MEEIIGKVRLNLKFYEGTDPDADPVLEEKLLDIVQNEKDTEDYLTREDDGRILYCLSDIRKNILRWYGFDKNAKLLEIGSDCGSVTGLFCDSCASVTAVEPSKKLSEINAYRNSDKDNLEIIVGKLDKIAIQDKYDYITLIGALEKAGRYAGGDDPRENLIKTAAEHLKPNGTLIIATGNKYGLKYWSGASDDSAGNVFADASEETATGDNDLFSKNGLVRLLESSGIGDIEFYYPVPDHKLPLYIYTDESLPESEIINTETVEYLNENVKLFNERRVSDELLKDGMYSEFANSFLVIGRK